MGNIHTLPWVKSNLNVNKKSITKNGRKVYKEPVKT